MQIDYMRYDKEQKCEWSPHFQGQRRGLNKIAAFDYRNREIDIYVTTKNERFILFASTLPL